MKRLLLLIVVACVVVASGAALAWEGKLIMVEHDPAATDDVLPPDVPLVSIWIGWSPVGAEPHGIGSSGLWDFDDRGAVVCPIEDDFTEYIKNGAYAQYWTSEDVLAQKALYWHAEDYTGIPCSGNPITGTYSAWCGKLAPDPGECFVGAPGYGHSWNQWLCRTVTMDPITPSLAYNWNGNSEPGFDYTYVIIDGEFPDSRGWVGDNSDTLRCYDGPTSGSENIDLAAWDDGNDCDEIPADPNYSGDSVKVCFVLVSDGGWDDEDGMYPTCDGGVNVDDIVIDVAHSSGDLVTTTFETGTLEGWEVCGGFSPGDYTAIRDRGSFDNKDERGFDNCDMAGCVLTFYNPNISGQYGLGGHYDGDFHKRAWSPTIDMTSYPPRGYCVDYDVYADLRIPNWIFYRHYCKYVQDVSCPVGVWSPPTTDNYVYYASTPACTDRRWDFSSFVPTAADSVKIGVSAWNGCEVWETQCTNGNETPIFDNIRLGIWDLSAPLASIRAVDNYTDAFPEEDAGMPTMATNTGLIDAANNLSQEGDFLRLADSAVIQLDAPGVYAEFCFRIEPGPGTNLTDPFFTTKYPDAGGWVACQVSDDYFCTKMDTAFAAGNGDTASTFEYQKVFEGFFATLIHEDDPLYVAEGEEILPDSLFTPGTKIYYGFRTSFLPGSGPYNWLPFGSDIVNDLSSMYEVEVLPDLCKNPVATLLYVDYYNRGAQDPIEAALVLLNRTWDRFDLRGESSHQANGIGNRLLGRGKYRLARGPIGPSNSHLTQYKAMLVNNGNFGTGVTFSDGGKGMPDDPSNDVTFLDNWINEGPYKGLWMSGDNIACDFFYATGGSPKNGFLSWELGTILVDWNLRNLINWDLDDNCIIINTRDGAVGSYAIINNKYAIKDAFFLTGIGCPQAYTFDVLGENDAAPDLVHSSAMYWPGGYACGKVCSIDHIFTAQNTPFDTVRTRLDGFGTHNLRDNNQCVGTPIDIALWIRDVLGGYNNNGFFYDRGLSVQYCQPQGPADPILDVPRGGKTYANALFQNYPNPFRGGTGTTIHYSVAKPGQVEIRIFDVAGRLVNTIGDQAKLGDNFVIWDGKSNNGRSVASGVYFYQIKAGEFMSHKKMLLVN